MGRARTQRREEAPQEAFMGRLMSGGNHYSEQEARMIMQYVDLAIYAEGIPQREQERRQERLDQLATEMTESFGSERAQQMIRDADNLVYSWGEAYASERDALRVNSLELSGLNAEEVGRLFAGHMWARQERTVETAPEEPRPALARTYRYTVEVGDREYDLQLSSRLPDASRSTLGTGRRAALRDMVLADPSSIVAVTSGGQTVDRTDFIRDYSSAFMRMMREDNPNLITISSRRT